MLSKSSIWIESSNFYGGIKSRGIHFIVIGLDTEYKTLDDPVEREGLEQGLGRNTILSYQVHCKIYDDSNWTCSVKVESFLPMKGELDEQAEGFYAGV